MSVQPSQVLPAVLDSIGSWAKFTVFDAGNAVPVTLDFFSAYPCRVYFANLGGELADRSARERDPRAFFEKVLDYPETTQFDVCLFWNVLNFLDRSELTAFAQALQPFLHRETRAHCFSALKGTTPSLDREYGITAMDELIVRPLATARGVRQVHTQGDIALAFRYFDIKRTTLLKDGQLELLLGAP